MYRIGETFFVESDPDLLSLVFLFFKAAPSPLEEYFNLFNFPITGIKIDQTYAAENERAGNFLDESKKIRLGTFKVRRHPDVQITPEIYLTHQNDLIRNLMKRVFELNAKIQ